MRAKTVEMQAKVLATVKAPGVTVREVADALGWPERTARRYLATLFKDGKIAREGAYAGTPPVFTYTYKPKGRKGGR